eukprot:Em0020g1078a
MQSYFQKTLTQNCGRYVCVQLLQTLNIMFENIRNETSIYYLLSNNHVNSLIVLKLDFSDEEVLAYYISFLKTLSFKLNKHTIHFFYNEHLRDFPLYNEAVKFFSHSESMVRIAVRTLTLNVFKVDNPSAIQYICNKGASPYFSNLTWLIGNHAISMDEWLISPAQHHHRNKLESMVAEHLDHLHYLNDILSLQVPSLGDILVDHLLNRLLIPLYACSLSDQRASKDATPHISTTMAAFLLSQVFVTLSHSTLVTLLAYFILSGDESLMLPANFTQPSHVPRTPRGFLPPDTGLEPSGYVPARPVKMHWRKRSGEEMSEEDRAVGAGPRSIGSSSSMSMPLSDGTRGYLTPGLGDSPPKVPVSPRHGVPISDSSYRDAILKSLAIHSADSRCFFSLFLLLSMLQNSGINPMLLEAFQLKPVPSENGVAQYSDELVTQLINILYRATQNGNPVRLITLHLAIQLLYRLVDRSGASVPLRDEHFALLEHAYEASILQLSHFCRGSKDELFLDMFEEEYMNEMAFNVKLNFLVMDGFMLLPPLDTPTTGIDFAKRLPNGDTEKARKAMRVFLAIHNAHHDLYKLEESELPFSRSEYSAHIGESIDLNNYHLFACKGISDNIINDHFMVVTDIEVMLVSPVVSPVPRPGWGLVQYIVFLQTPLTEPVSTSQFTRLHPKKRPALPPKFQFKDHISCLAAKKCLLNNKDKLRMAKMSRIRKLFRFPDHATVAAEEGAFATADETASSSSDSDTSLVVVHSTLVPNRSQCSPQPPPSHYIELTTLSSPPFDPTNPPDPHSEDDVDVHLDSSTLQAIIRIHKSKTQQDNGQMFNEPEENSSHGDKEETEQQL